MPSETLTLPVLSAPGGGRYRYLRDRRHVRKCAPRRVRAVAETRTWGLQGLQQGLKRPKRSNTEQKRGTAARQTAVKASICDRRITYEPGGRGFKSCRARQFLQVVMCVAHDHLSFGRDLVPPMLVHCFGRSSSQNISLLRRAFQLTHRVRATVFSRATRTRS